MATAILRSQNCFRDRYHPESLTPSHLSKSGGKSRTGYVSNHESGARRRNRSLAGFRLGEGKSRSRAAEAENPANNLVMGKVKILKRGETLTSLRRMVDCDADGDGDGESKRREVNRAEDILKRGETLTSWRRMVDCDGDGDGESKRREVNRAEDLDLFLGSTDRLGPDADTVQKQISFRNRLAPDGSAFSGFGFFFSPSPNSLPIPGFLARSK